jgi:hypothetical protein
MARKASTGRAAASGRKTAASRNKPAAPPANFITSASPVHVEAWNPVQVVLTANGDRDPLGSPNATTIDATGGAFFHYAQAVSGAAFAANGGDYSTVSCFVKSNGRATWALVGDDAHSALYLAWINLTTGVIGATSPNTTAVSRSVGDGWYRVEVTYQIPVRETFVPTQVELVVGPTSGNGVSVYTPSGESMLAWGGQVVRSTMAQGFTPNIGTIAETRNGA